MEDVIQALKSAGLWTNNKPLTPTQDDIVNGFKYWLESPTAQEKTRKALLRLIEMGCLTDRHCDIKRVRAGYLDTTNHRTLISMVAPSSPFSRRMN